MIQPLLGDGGTGKSYFIHVTSKWAMKTLIQTGDNPNRPKILLLAPTGKAASLIGKLFGSVTIEKYKSFCIGGQTLHYAFDFKFGTEHNALGNKKRDEYRDALKDLEIIIIDELSMVSADMLYRLELRLCEIFMSEDHFGGKIVIFVGDPLQLKPVKARYIFSNPSCQRYSPMFHMDSLWEKFKSIVLKTNHRQGSGTDWCQILNRARVGELTNEDKEILESRRMKHHPNVNFENAWHVFYPNKEVKAYNMKKLRELPGQSVIIPAKMRYPRGYVPNIKEWGTIDDTQFEENLEIKRGSRVILVFNVAVSDSLVNGEVGQILNIIKDETKKEVKAIIVQFDNPEAGIEHRKNYASFLAKNCIKSGTPIFRSTLEYNLKLRKGSRRHGCTGKICQFPLRLADSFTAHKLQGVTSPEGVPFVCHGHPNLQTGMGYVMLSRCRRLEDIYIDDNFDLDKIRPNEAAAMENARLNIESIVTNFQQDHLDLYMVNIRSLMKHKDVLKTDPYAMKSNVIAVVETHLEPTYPTSNMNISGKTFIAASIGKGKGCGLYLPEQYGEVILKVIRATHQMITVNFQEQFQLVLMYLSSECPYSQVVEDIQAMNLDYDGTFFVGDFNFDANESNALTKFMKSKDLCQMIDSPTHEKGRMIDHFYCPDALSDIVNVKLVYPFFSDHSAICVKFLE